MNFSNMFYNTSMVLAVLIYGTIFSVILSLITAFPLLFGWNYVIPYLFGLPELNYWMSFWLLWIVCSLWKITPIPFETKSTKSTK